MAPTHGARTAALAKALCAPCVVFLLVFAACGRIGMELLPLSDGGSTDGDAAGGGPGNRDGAVGASDAGGGDGMRPDAGVTEPDVCVNNVCSSDVDRCLDDPNKNSPGICGCGVSDKADGDDDGIADCIDLCSGAPDVLAGGQCGCEAAAADRDGDGTANCQDLCPDDADKVYPLVCGCGVSDRDTDGDGMPDCADRCETDRNKVVPGVCGCTVVESDLDTDSDGEPDCIDVCNGVDDASYEPDQSCGEGYCRETNTPSVCSEGVETACIPGVALSATDATCDGVDDDCDGAVDEDYAPTATSCGQGACTAQGLLICVNGASMDTCAAGTAGGNDATCDGVDDDCDGTADDDYVPTATSCGVGACRRTGSLVCAGGTTSDTCRAGTAAANDATCNGIDDDCDGTADEHYVPTATSCGDGVCRRTGSMICTGGTTSNTCTPGAPTSAIDDAVWPGNGLDDDCDGDIDEDSVSPCDGSSRTFGVGSHTSISVPTGCTSVTVQLWGGGGSAGGGGSQGRGGAGGYAQSTLTISGALQVLVGNGGSGCTGGGSNPGAATYNGGAGGADGFLSTAGSPGAEGTVAGGGAGAASSGGKNGGRGNYGGGGGGGGASAAWPPYAAAGGGGGAASVVLMGGTRVMVAGGGGGGGGTTGTGALPVGSSGVGGEGCGGAGGNGSGGGGGGGGGVCTGTTTTPGTNGVPASGAPTAQARGGQNACSAGGGGYAILTFGP